MILASGLVGNRPVVTEWPLAWTLTLSQPRQNVLDMQLTLFGEWELVREWGRIGQAGRLAL